MSNFKNIKVPAERDGTSRKKRLPDTLLPDYVAVDERSKNDLLEFVKAYASKLLYYDVDDQPTGKWDEFFVGEPTDQPHYALLLSFLELFRLSQNNLNTFTKRHLDFFYSESLRFVKKCGTPDKVHVILELAKNVNTHLLKEGTLFNAGKNNTGATILYKLIDDVELNKALIADIKTLFLKKDETDFVIKEFDEYATEIETNVEGVLGFHINSVDEQHANSFSALGDADVPTTDIGFAIAAPIFFLREGERTISVNISGTGEVNNPLENCFSQLTFEKSFKIFFSAANGWMEVDATSFKVVSSNLGGNVEMEITLTIPSTKPSLIAFDPKIHEGNFETQWPVMKVLLQAGAKNPYSVLKSLAIDKTEIKVDVVGVRNVLLQNNTANLDANKPFYPFGQTPSPGSDFYVGNAEIFQKQLESLAVNLEWYGLPDQSLENYYQGYSGQRSNKNFKADFSLLSEKHWKKLETASLFDETKGGDLKTISFYKTTARVYEKAEQKQTGYINIGEDASLQTLDHYNMNSERGFLKVTLSDPDFGHHEYQNLFRNAIKSTSTAPLPNQPYTPILKSISLDYSAHCEIESWDSQKDFFHLHPFGNTKQTTIDDTQFLLPQYEDEGYLFIGFKELQPTSELSILFQPVEGTADPDCEQPEIKWSYLLNDLWIDFHRGQILYDSTENFNSPGIITFSIPADITSNNSLLPKNIFWIKASAFSNSRGTCKMIGLRTQAAILERCASANSTIVTGESLPPGSISKLQFREAGIKTVSQPYASVQGKRDEQDEEFYTRISERLRHKERALTCWDYERLVLENFPSLYKVKCFKHASYVKGNNPGNVLMIIIPNTYNNPSVQQLQPLASVGIMENVKAFLKTVAPPFVEIEVKNPVYEKIGLDFMVKFHEGYNNGFYEQQLQIEIRKFLSPWAFQEGREISFEGIIYKSSILQFTEALPYVDFVAFFKMNHTDMYGNVRVNVEEAMPCTALSILTSNEKHNIKVVNDDTDLCADGIGHMIIEKTFITIK